MAKRRSVEDGASPVELTDNWGEEISSSTSAHKSGRPRKRYKVDSFVERANAALTLPKGPQSPEEMFDHIISTFLRKIGCVWRGEEGQALRGPPPALGA